MALRPRWVWLASTLAMLGVVSLWVGVWLVQVEQYRPRIVQFLQQVTNRTVAIESVSISLAEGILLDLEGVEIRSQDEKSPPVFSAKHVLIGVGVEYFLRRSLTLSSITLVSPHFNLVRYVDGATLFEEARRNALASDKVLEEQLGSSISQFHVGRLSVRDGLVNLADWGRENDQTMVFDKVQANIYHISPAAPSPITATARFHSVPFKVNGQVGPLPVSLNPHILPILLSFEAKTIPFSAVEPWLPPLVAGERGYFSALVQGTIQEGLATSSWLEMEKLTVPGREGEKKTVAVAVRQKSLLRFGVEPQDLQIQEFYCYVDGSPWLKVEGGLGVWPFRHVDMTVTALRPITLGGLQDSPLGRLEGQVGGQLHFFGHPFEWLQVSGEVDMEAVAWHWPQLGIEKEKGKPLTLFPRLFRQHGEWRLNGLQFSAGEEGDLTGHLEGTLSPEVDLTVHGQGTWQELADFFPQMGQWSLAGGRWSWQGQMSRQHWQGEVTIDQGHWGEQRLHQVVAPFQRQGGVWQFSPLSLRFNPAGSLDASLQVVPEEKRYRGVLTLSGLSVGDLPDLTTGPGLHRRFDGLLQMQGEVNGALDEQGFLRWPQGGRLAAVVEPGGMLGVGNGVLTERPKQETTLSQAGKTFYWQRAAVELLLTDAGVRINDLSIDTGQARLTGSGWVEGGQGLDMILQIDAPWWQPETSLRAQVFGTLDDIRLKPLSP